MHRTCRPRLQKINSIVLFCLIIIALPTLQSCFTQQSTQSSLRHLVYRSDEYIICKLKSNETSEALAKGFLNNSKKSWIIEDANQGTLFRKGEVIVIPLKQENKGGITANGYQTVPVIGYNRFSKSCKKSSCIPAQVFDQQMKYLKDNNYRVITMAEFLDFLYYQNAIPKRSIVITIDDGHRSAYDIAYPILKRYGLTATFFVYTDSISIDKITLTWDQLKQIKADGFEVGSFTLSHRDLTKKKEKEDNPAYMTRIKRELLLSKQIIDKKLSQNTIYLAFPFGQYNQSLLNISDQVGYKLAFSMQPGSNPFFSDPLSLKRKMILKKDMKAFIAHLKTFHQSPLRK